MCKSSVYFSALPFSASAPLLWLLWRRLCPKSIRSCSSSQKRLLPARRCKSSTQTNTHSFASDLAVGFQLLQNPTCAQSRRVARI